MNNLPESIYHYRPEYTGEPVRQCDYCNENIHVGDMIYVFDDGTTIHNHCLQDYMDRFSEIAE